MITERILQDQPALVKALMGIPPALFWDLVAAITPPADPAQPSAAPQRRRGRPCAHRMAVRVGAILTYLRLHVPQTVVALLFGIGQEDVSRDLRRLLPLLHAGLPCPEVWSLPSDDEVAAGAAPTPAAPPAPRLQARALVDATEQAVQRPQDALDRAALYSGKRKACTLKTQLVSDDDHHICAISTAVPGAVHDKTLADQLQTVVRVPTDCELLGDKGYQGLAKAVPLMTVSDPVNGAQAAVPRLRVLTPIKQRTGQDLPADQVAFNQAVSQIRVRIEHLIGWIKNWSVLATRFRCDHAIYTTIMQVVCGLVNHQTARWQAAKAKAGICA